ncbi:Hypothetical protein, putative [Bodo saltans]|uniref:Nucleotide exchange factor Fes1 domain-containing protein n=1 Tax=Bodo saltans TaxID=75058 RepID=A0A0S4KKF7_BODSA|nr:Hypothetical protein, putative [Bodo saltans]|eukprot:CUI15078.1 Hypothetical protein, putative [Bodo saltans]
MSNDPVINSALFRFCQLADDGPRTAPTEPRNLADLQWLREALEAVEAPEKIVQKLLLTIGKDDTSNEDFICAVEELSDMVEDMNWALEFVLMGGHVIILRLLESSQRAKQSAEVRKHLALVVAHASQQNDKVQKAFNDAKWADVIVPLTRSEEDQGALAAFLHACSCMCRECDEGSAAFLASKGLEVLQKLLSPQCSDKINDKIANRVLFLVAYFSRIGVSSSDLIESTCMYVVSPASSTETSIAATNVVNQVLIKSPALLTTVRKIVLPYLEGLEGLAKDDPRSTLRKMLTGDANR